MQFEFLEGQITQHRHHIDITLLLACLPGNTTHLMSTPSPTSYTPRNILITGGAGFIGSHTVILFASTYPQYNIINIDKLDYCSSLINLQSIANLTNYKFIKGDICSPDLMNYIFKTHNIDTVLHFAAQTHVDNSFGNSFSFTRNNVMGTHVLLEAAKEHWKSSATGSSKDTAVDTQHRFIHVSTDEVYGEGECYMLFSTCILNTTLLALGYLWHTALHGLTFFFFCFFFLLA